MSTAVSIAQVVTVLCALSHPAPAAPKPPPPHPIVSTERRLKPSPLSWDSNPHTEFLFLDLYLRKEKPEVG